MFPSPLLRCIVISNGIIAARLPHTLRMPHAYWGFDRNGNIIWRGLSVFIFRFLLHLISPCAGVQHTLTHSLTGRNLPLFAHRATQALPSSNILTRQGRSCVHSLVRASSRRSRIWRVSWSSAACEIVHGEGETPKLMQNPCLRVCKRVARR